MDPPRDASLLDVVGSTVRAGRRLLVRDVGFDARAGEVVAIVGANGAGKTTLLEAIVGLRPATGEVRVGGRPIRRFADAARAFSFLPDAAPLPAEVRVATLIEHALSVRPRPREIVDALLDALELGVLLGAPAAVLSRGERQRVGLFAALAVERPIVVLDEPLAPFDPLKLRRVLGALRLVASAGSAIVASVHQLADAEKLAARFLVLADRVSLGFGGLDSLRVAAGLATGTLEDVFLALLDRGRDAA
jgi:ABC-type multidrug transport system ATPase subunit